MSKDIIALLAPKVRRKTRIGLVAGGLGAYWPQFPQLLPQLQESTAYVVERFQAMDADVTDVGFVSDAQHALLQVQTQADDLLDSIARLTPLAAAPDDYRRI